MSIAALLRSVPGDAIAVRDAAGEWTGEQLRARVAAFAAHLDALAAPVVASRLDNGPDWVALDLALRLLGRVHVPLPTFFTAAQLEHALHTAGAGALVLPREAPRPAALATAAASPLGERLRVLAFTATPVALPRGTACITFTSGTTGAPKGVCLGEDVLLAVAHALADAPSPLAPRSHLCLMPLSTLLENIAGVYAAMLRGATTQVPSLAEVGYSGASGLDLPTLIGCLHRYQPESAILFPALLQGLVQAAGQGVALPASFRFLAVGGAPAGAVLIERAIALGLPVHEGYGLSECASVVCLNRPGARRPGSVGRPLPHAQVSVVDGELIVDGPRALGYLGDATLPPGPIATGDLGFIDDDGFVHVTGRRKHMFITAYGRNVSPEWVEAELLQHPAIAQVVVHGEARPFNVAIVVPRDPACSDADLRAALDAVNPRLPDYARVRLAVRAEVPFTAATGLATANGRPMRDAIVARHRAAIDAAYAPADPIPVSLPTELHDAVP